MPHPNPRHTAPTLLTLAALALTACAARDPLFRDDTTVDRRAVRPHDSSVPASPRTLARAESPADDRHPALTPDATLNDYLRYAALSNNALEAAFQRWRAAVERVPQVGALPDPRFRFGFYLDEVETRVGPQQARFGIAQTFPWLGALADRKDAAARAAMAAWRTLEDERLALAQRVTAALYELAYLDRSIDITRENIDLLIQFERVVRARYRVGATPHPELIRVQVELGKLEDRLRQLNDLRPAHVARLNAALSRPDDASLPATPALPDLVADADPLALATLARQANPALLALDERVEEQRILTDVARKESIPDLTVGLDYIATDEAVNPSIPESGDDPILLSFSLNLPLWRDKYEAAEREAVARRLAVAADRADRADRIAADLRQAWFDHIDADRRVALYDDTLIPKATESLQASLASFRAGDSSFLDLLETERTLLEFALARERARADRAIALATLERLVGADVPTRRAADAPAPTDQEQPE